MSRRVFDVGLDMGRMRHSLKPHKNTKRSKSSRSVTREEDHFANSEMNGSADPKQMVMVPQLEHKESDPTTQPRQGLDNRHPDDTVVLHSIDEFGALPNSTPSGNQGNGNPPQTSKTNPLGANPTNLGEKGIEKRASIQNFDLKPPPPNTKVKHIDTLSARLLSGDHLNVILKDPTFFLRFTAFLNRYKPHLSLGLMRYLEAQKAYKAVEYANALSETLTLSPDDDESKSPAASIDPQFEARAKKSFDALVTEALPAYITTCLTKVVTEYMVREITGTGVPVMRELVGGLAEVFCLADPSIEDCPIIYASEEFYRTSRYSRDDVLGRNCRFLQGPKTDRATIARLSSRIKSGQESCEVVLNYRRDGTPFMNLLLIAPLHDNRGAVKYFIGAQIDVSGLIEDGRGLETFERLLFDTRPSTAKTSETEIPQKHLRALNELGQMLSVDETSIFTRHSRESSSINDDTFSAKASSNRSTPRQQKWRDDPRPRRPRVVLGDDEVDDEPKDKNNWSLSPSLQSGKLPGVYQNYLLLRPHPSLRIIFVSPSLRIPGLLQSPFLSHITGPPHVKAGLSDAFEQCAAVTAKVSWVVSTNGNGGGEGDARPRYISCTPLMGADDEVGVWMVVMVENEAVTGGLARRERFGFGGLRQNGGGGDGVQDEDYASYMRNSTVGSPAQSRGNDSVRNERNGEGSGLGGKSGVNGLGSEGRVEEVFTPSDEKRSMM